MKIALFVSQFPVRSQTFVIRQAMDIVSAGHDLTVISLSAGDEWSAFSADVQAQLAARIVVLDRGEGRHWASFAASQMLFGNAAKQTRARVKAARLGEWGLVKRLPAAPQGRDLGHFDAVLAHFGPAGVTAMILREAGVFSGPIATVFHGYDMSVRSILQSHYQGYRALFRETELMLPISKLWAARLVTWGCDPDKVRVHHMGTDLSASTPHFDRPIGTRLDVVCVGRLTAKKGQKDAIEGAQSANSPINFSIIGEGELEEELRDLAASGGHQEINFLGPLNHDRTLQQIAESDVLLLTSKVADDGDMEGIPVALMEAMARGVLVLATRHSGNPELVVDGETGFLVDEGSPAEIAATLDRIAAGDMDLKAIRQAAYKKISEEFDNAKLAPELLSLLREIAIDSPE